MYKIILSRTAEKDLGKVDKKYKSHIFTGLFDLKKDPYLGKKLKGRLHNYYSLRIGIYRIIYKIYKTNLSLLMIRIGSRQGVYG